MLIIGERNTIFTQLFYGDECAEIDLWKQTVYLFSDVHILNSIFRKQVSQVFT